MSEENNVDREPTECLFCGKTSGEVGWFNVCHAFHADGLKHVGALCSECVRLFLIQMALTNRRDFERFVEEACGYHPGPGAGAGADTDP
jgi:hypothetical protein